MVLSQDYLRFWFYRQTLFQMPFLPHLCQGVSGLVSPSALLVKETRERLLSVTVGANAGICFYGYGTFTQVPRGLGPCPGLALSPKLSPEHDTP